MSNVVKPVTYTSGCVAGLRYPSVLAREVRICPFSIEQLDQAAAQLEELLGDQFKLTSILNDAGDEGALSRSLFNAIYKVILIKANLAVVDSPVWTLHNNHLYDLRLPTTHRARLASQSFLVWYQNFTGLVAENADESSVGRCIKNLGEIITQMAAAAPQADLSLIHI